MLRTAPMAPGLGGADNSLSRAIYCLQTMVSQSVSGAFAGAIACYGAVRFVEGQKWVRQRRGMRWMAPSAAALVAAYFSSKVRAPPPSSRHISRLAPSASQHARTIPFAHPPSAYAPPCVADRSAPCA